VTACGDQHAYRSSKFVATRRTPVRPASWRFGRGAAMTCWLTVARVGGA
jgi:hypothetical protein